MRCARRVAATTALIAVVAAACGPSGSAASRETRQAITTEPRSITTRSITTTVRSSTTPRSVAPPPPTISRPPWRVARTEVTFTDMSRATPARGSQPAHAGRVLHTTVLWPVRADGVVAPGRHALVVFAHGYATSAATYSGLLDDLVEGGLVVAAPEFPGESSALPGPPVESDLVNEPCDVEFVAASIQRTPPRQIASAVEGAPFVVAGHSDGATAAAAAAYASDCAGPAPRAVVALSPDDVPMSGAYRFGPPPPLLAVTGTADEINPVAHTLALWQHVPAPAWLLTVDGGSHLGTFTTDPDRKLVDAVIIDFVLAEVEHDTTATIRLSSDAHARLHLRRR